MTKPETLPTFTGLLLHREPTQGYSFFVPNGWHCLKLPDNGKTVLYAPATSDPFTFFSANLTNLEVEVTPDDLPDLRRGFLRGLRSLPGSRVKLLEATAVGQLVNLEAYHAYREDDVARKRWVRLLYLGSRQARLVAQGATRADFDYWLPMFNQSMRTFRFGDWGLDAGIPADDWEP